MYQITECGEVVEVSGRCAGVEDVKVLKVSVVKDTMVI